MAASRRLSHRRQERAVFNVRASPTGYLPTDGHQLDSVLRRKAPSDINSIRQCLDDMIATYDPLPVFRSIVKYTNTRLDRPY